MQKDSYRSETGCQMFEGEVPWKSPLTSSAFLPLQLLIHWHREERERRKRCAMVNVRFSVTINENSSSTPFIDMNPNTHPLPKQNRFWSRSNREASVLRSNQISQHSPCIDQNFKAELTSVPPLFVQYLRRKQMFRMSRVRKRTKKL